MDRDWPEDDLARRGFDGPLPGDDVLPELTYDEPAGYEVVGFWCWRAGGHLCDYSCKSDSVPLLAQKGWAARVRGNILEHEVRRG